MKSEFVKMFGCNNQLESKGNDYNKLLDKNSNLPATYSLHIDDTPLPMAAEETL